MDARELKGRTKAFASRILKLSGAIPRTISGRAITSQLVRSGTAVAANYRASCRAWSKAEFAAKIGIVEEEADETAFWLELLGESQIVSWERLGKLLQEANELTAIMAASRKTVSRNREPND